MREELKDFDWYTYGLSEEDFDYTLRLVKEMINARRILLEQEKAQVTLKYDEDDAVEIISDIAHYSWVDSQYLWQFCLWRLQGIFEKLIINDFLNNQEENDSRRIFGGLKSILNEVQKGGYVISENIYRNIKLFKTEKCIIPSASRDVPTSGYRRK